MKLLRNTVASVELQESWRIRMYRYHMCVEEKR